MNEDDGGFRILLNAHRMAGSLCARLAGALFLLGHWKIVTEHPRPHQKFAIDSFNIIQSLPTGGRAM